MDRNKIHTPRKIETFNGTETTVHSPIVSQLIDDIRASSLSNDQKEQAREWLKMTGDELIMQLPNEHTIYFGHSTARIDWLLNGKGLRVGKNSGMGSLGNTAIEMPNTSKEFLEHLKTRVNPDINYYHRGPYLVVLAIPPKLYTSYGYHPETGINDPLGSSPIKNVKVIEVADSSLVVPPRFILGYYSGEDNTFYTNPKWETHPEPTQFGINAENKLLQTVNEPFTLGTQVDTATQQSNSGVVISTSSTDDIF